MKRLFIIFSIIILITVNKKNKNQIIIPKESIRIRVLANSNNIEDQILKYNVKKEVEKTIYSKLNKVKKIEEARNIITNNMQDINDTIKNVTKDFNYSINYGNNYFPKKELYGIEYKEGNYESLLITLGEGIGKNWWCVLFPPLCQVEVKDNDTNYVEYKSKIIEIINAYK